MVNGIHFILDAECSEREKLKDERLMHKVLNDLPELVGMSKLTKPLVVKGAAHNPGLTGVVVIETSNIVFHTFTDSNKFSLDVFSVKEFDQEKVISYLRKHFNFRIIRNNLFERL
ncbi:MAG: S-adenosylmethionine decarboxylase [Nanoarchaeota archaeon]|mgnify:CR=1 FL=1